MSIRKETDDLIAFLDSVARLDPVAMGKLLVARVPCNQAIRDHNQIQVMGEEDGLPPGEYSVGLLGILNGYAGTFEEGKYTGFGPVSAILEDDGSVSGFVRTDRAGKP